MGDAEIYAGIEADPVSAYDVLKPEDDDWRSAISLGVLLEVWDAVPAWNGSPSENGRLRDREAPSSF
jgi:hypothetical protein